MTQSINEEEKNTIRDYIYFKLLLYYIIFVSFRKHVYFSFFFKKK